MGTSRERSANAGRGPQHRTVTSPQSVLHLGAREQPAPYDPPRTSTETLRPQGPSSPPVIDVVRPPQSANQSGHRRRWLLAVGAVAAVTAAAVVFWPEPGTTDQPGNLDDQASPSATVAAPPRLDPRLVSLLPAGYPPGACKPVPADNRSAAECGPNIDAPNTSSRFTLHQDADALAAALDQFISGTTVLVCPGNYLSPGPWRRNAALDVPVGTLVCGTSPRGIPGSAGPSTASDCLPALNPLRAAPRSLSSTTGGRSTPDPGRRL